MNNHVALYLDPSVHVPLQTNWWFEYCVHILFKYFTHLQLAEAGFYHCPTKEEPDAVRCFFCMKELDGWEPDDDPWYIMKHLPLTRHPIYCIFAFKFKFLFDNFETGVTCLFGVNFRAEHESHSPKCPFLSIGKKDMESWTVTEFSDLHQKSTENKIVS